MKLVHLHFVLLAAIVIGGCAAQPKPAQRTAATHPATTRSAIVTTQPVDPMALLSLDEIQPPAVMPPAPTSQPGVAPLEALQLYARARAAVLDNRRIFAVPLLEKAIQLD